MATKRAWAMAFLAAVLWIAAALVLPGNASAHPGHGAPVAAVPPLAAASGNLGLSPNDSAYSSVGSLEAAVSVHGATGKQVPAATCTRTCCVGGTPCAGAYALDLTVAALAPPQIQRAHRIANATGGEGVTPQALPKPPRSNG